MPQNPAALAPAIVVALALLLVACGGEDGDEDGATPANLPAGCEEAQKPPPKRVHLKRPKRTVDRSQSLVAAVDTSCGSFEIALDARDSPKTVSSFVYMVREGVYDDTAFHRIVSGFVIQGGDPGTASGGPGYSVDEPPPNGAEYTRGTVAMVKTVAEPPGRSGSQFFIVTAADAGLPPQYALLGQVSSGEDVIDRIAELGDPASGQTGTPTATVVIRKITIGGG
jgi:peptidyl-prolyl cis-trans isomerase B (cyclophilin B)